MAGGRGFTLAICISVLEISVLTAGPTPSCVAVLSAKKGTFSPFALILTGNSKPMPRRSGNQTNQTIQNIYTIPSIAEGQACVTPSNKL
ncbi:hypothetical protein D623_10029236 [Myotis brandtii]|uniref:Secreted protein n=1 Tax=Myotis brandtii TaxID=109478 RepID=S7N3M7_MYOBR|nr:hypothetical protein D623_10029236 [Myotis brandtii]